jgi:hypothetical protein
MIIDVEHKDEDGNIIFNGKLNKSEATFVLNVGINYLLAHGCLPQFTGKEEEVVVHGMPTTKQ